MKSVILILLMVTCSSIAFGQPGQAAPSDPGGGVNPFDVPISGIEWLFVAGGVFGARAIYRKFRQK